LDAAGGDLFGLDRRRRCRALEPRARPSRAPVEIGRTGTPAARAAGQVDVVDDRGAADRTPQVGPDREGAPAGAGSGGGRGPPLARARGGRGRGGAGGLAIGQPFQATSLRTGETTGGAKISWFGSEPRGMLREIETDGQSPGSPENRE